MLVGRAAPRVSTKPLRPLTPATSDGYAIVDWARSTLGWNPMPWQRWVIIHAGEKLPDGSPRFSNILVEVARQNGKTSLINTLALYWLAHGIPLVLGTSSTLDVAREGWEYAVQTAEDTPEVFGKVKVRRSNGDWQLSVGRGRYKVCSASRRGGRGLTVHRLIEDELREHHSWDAHAAAANATVAVPDAQTWMLSNAGSPESIVLDHFRALGLSGEDPTLGYYGWTAPEGCELSDREAWRQANPGLGYTITERALEAKLAQPASIFRVENLCQSTASASEVVTSDAWSNCYDPGTLDSARSRVALCLDVSPDLQHATLCAAAMMPDSRCRVEVVAAWTSTSEVRQDLPELLAKIKPRVFGWYPHGPAAALRADLSTVRRAQGFSAAETSAACQGFAEYVAAGRVAHAGDELLAAHILGAKRYSVGDGWRFSRRDGGHCDAAYAAAGAVHLARSIPAPPKLRLVTAPTDVSTNGILERAHGS